MNPPKLEFYGNHSGATNNGLANVKSNGAPSFAQGLSASPSTSVSGSDDERDGSKKRKRPMNVTYVLVLSTVFTTIYHYFCLLAA